MPEKNIIQKKKNNLFQQKNLLNLKIVTVRRNV